MTTIAWDGKTLAGDRQTNMGKTPIARTKVYAHTECKGQIDYLIGCSGITADCQAFILWYINGQGKRPAFDDLSAIVIRPGGSIAHYAESENVHDMGVLPYWAIGSGADFALGALAYGATAEEAIEIATKLDIYTGLGIDKVTF